jgi:hypothetical protein
MLSHQRCVRQNHALFKMENCDSYFIKSTEFVRKLLMTYVDIVVTINTYTEYKNIISPEIWFNDLP